MNPNDPNHQLTIGEIYYMMEDYRKSIQEFDAIIERYPNFADAYYHRAWSKIDLELEDSTIISDLETSLNLSTSDSSDLLSEIIFTLAKIYRSKKDYDLALYYANKILNLDSVFIINMNIEYWVAEAYFFNGNYDTAIKHFENSLFVKEDNYAIGLFMIGRSYQHKELYDSAIVFYEEVFYNEYDLESSDKKLKPWLTLHSGICNFHLGNYDRAKSYLDKARKKWYKKEPQVYYYLGMIQNSEGNNKAASKSFKKASKLGLKDSDPLKTKLESEINNCR